MVTPQVIIHLELIQQHGHPVRLSNNMLDIFICGEVLALRLMQTSDQRRISKGVAI